MTLTRPLLALAVLVSPLAAQTALGTFPDAAAGLEGGSCVAHVGDVDGDLVGDLFIGQPGRSPSFYPGAGGVILSSGRTGEVLWDRNGTAINERFGHAVTGCGDVNGDGIPDVAASAPGHAVGGSFDRVRVLSGADGSVLHDLISSEDDDTGWSLAGNADTDGDGLLELLAGAPTADTTSSQPSNPIWTNAGVVKRFEFGPDGVTVEIVATGSQEGARCGHDVAVLDLDGDGDDDVLYGEPEHTSQVLFDHSGRVRVRNGAGSLLFDQLGVVSERLGHAVACAGEVDLDGLPDVAAGAPSWAGGAAYVFPTTAAVRSTGSGQLGALFGYDLVALGDHDGDGRDDLLVGAPRTFVFPLFGDGGSVSLHSGLDLSALWSRYGENADANLGWSLANMGDVDLDGLDDFATGSPFATGDGSDVAYTQLWSSVDAAASVASVGGGLAGTLGVPKLNAFGVPKLGGSTQIVFTNSAGVPTLAALHLGLAEAALPFKGGTLHTDPVLNLIIPNLPMPQLTLDLAIPFDTWLTGFELWIQGSQLDAGAPVGVALTRAIALTLGG